MKETDIRQQIFHMSHTEYPLWPITQTDAIICPRCHAKVKPPIGRPDILVLNPRGRSAVIEVKVIRGSSFSFKDIRPEQREWLTNWMNDDGLGYIGIGEVKNRDGFRKLWLIPWRVWLSAEELVSQFQGSVPAIAGRGMKKELQEYKLDMHTLFADYELVRKPGKWLLPEGHEMRGIINEFNRIESAEPRDGDGPIQAAFINIAEGSQQTTS